jgi:hypothetical protein
MTSVMNDLDPYPALETLEAHRDCAPIELLPSEILVQIFQWVQHRWTQSIVLDLHLNFNVAWVRVIRVCRRFRDVATHTPCLWTVIMTSKSPPEFIELCATRSQGLLLALNDEQEPGESLRLIHRAQLAQIVLPPRADGPASSDALNAPGIQLRSLEINHRDIERPFGITSALFGGTTHWLTDLTLWHVGIHLLSDAPFMPALRALSFNRITTDPELVYLSHFFTKTPALEHLTIDSLAVGYIGETPRRPCINPITLNNLKVANITVYSHLLAGLLRAMSKPTTALSVDVTNVTMDDASFGPHHDEVYQCCLEFIQHTSGIAGFQDGIASFGYVLDVPGVAEILFEPGLIGGDCFRPGQSDFRFMCRCILSGLHPLFKSITTVSFHEQSVGYDSVEDIEDGLCVKFLPNISRVHLELRGHVSEHPGIIPWILGRRDCIRHVMFGPQNRFSQIDSFAQDLHAQQSFPIISQWTTMGRIRVYWDGPVRQEPDM